jgi:NADPH:quinone reductase-like Zn-dependent oxidoreductase
VNPVDTLIRSGRYRTPLPGFPFIIGRDLVGEVMDAGPGVEVNATGIERFPIGSRVWTNSLGYDGRQGAASEFAVVPADRLYPLPPSVAAADSVPSPAAVCSAAYDPVAVVAALHPAATAYLGLFVHAGGVVPGSTVVVGGAAGNVGSCVCQLAALSGARVLALARADDPEEVRWCRTHGGDAVVDYRRPADELRETLRALAPDGVDLWFDTSGRIDLPNAVAVMADRGRIVLVAAGPTELGTAELPVMAFFRGSLRLVGFVISTATVAELATAARAVSTLLARGQLRLRIADVLPLDKAAQAHQIVESGVRGRVILRLR